MKRIFTSFMLMFSINFCFAQEVDISGMVKNSEDSTAIQYAVFSLVRSSDSILYKFTRTDVNGHFMIKNVEPGKYIMIVSHPKYADLVDDINVKSTIAFPDFDLTPKSKLLKEIIINTGSPIRIKGDTTIYTADSFVVSANANVEELLKKLPGMQVDKDGTIKAMGQTVQRVLVDGEEFFGSDPGMAVKNIRADAVKEVQVFDKKSEQAEFTGIDDGKTEKTINLKLKEDKKHGYFGKLDVAGGLQNKIEDRYIGNLMFGSFKGKRKFSAFLLSGNTEGSRLGFEDEMKYGIAENIEVNTDEGVSIMWRSTSDGEVYLDPENGFLSSTSAGMQYSNKWNDKQSLSYSPRYQQQSYRNRTTTYSRTQVSDSVLVSNSDELGKLTRHNFKNRAVIEYTIDSMNSIKLTAGANFYHTQSNKEFNSVSSGEAGNLKNTSERTAASVNDKSAIAGNFLYRHKFKKARRTLTFGGDWNVTDSKGTQYLQSFNQSYYEGGAAGSQSIDQMINNKTSSTNISGNINYTEPLGKELSLQVNYKLMFNNGKNDQFTYEHIPGNKEYTVVIDSLSNEFRSDIVQNIPGATLNFANKKLKVNVGSSLGFIDYKLHDISYDKEYDRHYTNFYPSANLTYKYKSNSNFNFNYSGSTKQPSMNQLQPLRNNNDYFNQYIGNPNLKPAFMHMFRIGHNSYNFIKNTWLYQSLGLSIQNNAITNSRIIDLDSGKTITKPINTDGNISANFWGGFGFKLKKLNINLDISPSFDYNRYVEMINNEKSYSKSFNPSLSISLSKEKAKKYDIYIANSFDYNWNSTAQSKSIVHYYTNRLSAWTTFYYKKVWSAKFDYTYYSQQASSQNTQNLNRHILNGRLQRTIRDDEFTFYFSVRDILNQNIGLERRFYGSTYSEVTNDRLRRYYIVGFTWNFKNKESKPQK